jgi:hypothetical protein
MKELEGSVPRCKTGEGCLVPPLGHDEAHALELRGLIARLGSLLGPEAVARAFGATRRDLLLLAAAEDALKEMESDDTP